MSGHQTKTNCKGVPLTNSTRNCYQKPHFFTLFSGSVALTADGNTVQKQGVGMAAALEIAPTGW